MAQQSLGSGDKKVPSAYQLEESSSEEDTEILMKLVTDIKNSSVKAPAKQYGSQQSIKVNVAKSVPQQIPQISAMLDSIEPSIGGVNLFDYNVDSTEHPWLRPGADITDYFNYGFTEDTWKEYCDRQKRMRQEIGASTSIFKPIVPPSASLSALGGNAVSAGGNAGGGGPAAAATNNSFATIAYNLNSSIQFMQTKEAHEYLKSEEPRLHSKSNKVCVIREDDVASAEKTLCLSSGVCKFFNILLKNRIAVPSYVSVGEICRKGVVPSIDDVGALQKDSFFSSFNQTKINRLLRSVLFSLTEGCESASDRIPKFGKFQSAAAATKEHENSPHHEKGDKRRDKKKGKSDSHKSDSHKSDSHKSDSHKSDSHGGRKGGRSRRYSDSSSQDSSSLSNGKSKSKSRRSGKSSRSRRH